MAVFSRVHVWVSNEVLTASALNAEFDNIIANMDADGIEGASANVSAMQAVTDPGGVGTESLASTITGELQRLRFKIKQIMSGAQWYSTPVGSLSTGGITANSLAAGAVTTTKILDGSVTKAKVEAIGQQLSSSSGTAFSGSALTATDITNLTCTITTTGRMVNVCFIPDPALTSSGIRLSQITNDISLVAKIFFVRDATTIADIEVSSQMKTANVNALYLPASAFSTYDFPAAGTYTYKAQYQVGDASDVLDVRAVKLLVYEVI